MRPRIIVAAFLAAFLIPAAGYAQSGSGNPYVGPAAAGLRASRLYIDPAVAAQSGLSGADASAVAGELAGISPPIYIAIEPEAALGNGLTYDTFAQAVGQAYGSGGTVGVVFPVSHHFRASSSTIRPSGTADQLSQASAATYGKTGIRPMIEDFIAKARAAATTSATGPAPAPPAAPASHTGLIVFLVILGLLVLGIAGYAAYRLSAGKKERAQEVGADRTRIEAMYDELGDDLTNHATDLGDNEEYKTALRSYQSAGGSLARATNPAQIEAVADILEHGRGAMARAKFGPGAVPPAFAQPAGGSMFAHHKDPKRNAIRRARGSLAPAPGSRHVINNQTAYYYPGGSYGGTYYGPGYYGAMDPWLSYMIAEDMIDEHEEMEGREGFNDDRSGFDGSASYDSPPSYDAPQTYDSGGFDSGGGGFDSGGGAGGDW